MSKATKWKTVDSSFATPWIPKKPGDALEGIYLGCEEIPSSRGDTFTSYRVRGADKQVWGVSGGMLRSRLDQVAVGTEVQVVFSGMVATSQGEAKDYKVNVPEGTSLMDPYAHNAPGEGEVAVPPGA